MFLRLGPRGCQPLPVEPRERDRGSSRGPLKPSGDDLAVRGLDDARVRRIISGENF